MSQSLHSLLRLLAATIFLVVAASTLSAADDGQPAFVHEPLMANSEAGIEKVASLPETDVILLDGGYDRGFRVGMTAQIERAGKRLGQVYLVEVRPTRAAALILSLEPGQTLRSGDRATLKTIHSIR